MEIEPRQHPNLKFNRPRGTRPLGRANARTTTPTEHQRVSPQVKRSDSVCVGRGRSIRQDITEELDYVPASFVIREYVRPKYACGRCQQGVVQAVLPARPIEKGRPGPGLLEHVVSSKYADHLPPPEQGLGAGYWCIVSPAAVRTASACREPGAMHPIHPAAPWLPSSRRCRNLR
jgi:transposase